jgi:hypothetical protein
MEITLASTIASIILLGMLGSILLAAVRKH